MFRWLGNQLEAVVIVVLVLALCILAVAVDTKGQALAGSRPLPVASDFDRSTAALDIARDGSRVTFRRPASPSMVVCFEFARRPESCTTLGALRAGAR